MSFFETLAAVFLAQLLAWACQWLIKNYFEPHVDRGHKKVKKSLKKILKKAQF